MSTADSDQQLFQDILLEHGQYPRCDSVPADTGKVLEAHDPQKGDRVRIGLRWQNGAIAAIGFEASGSTVLKASCSLLCENLSGKSRDDARALVIRTLAMIQDAATPVDFDNWGEIAALSAIRRFPARVQCASMPWRLATELLKDE